MEFLVNCFIKLLKNELRLLKKCMASIQEQFVIKSGLWWRAYGISIKWTKLWLFKNNCCLSGLWFYSECWPLWSCCHGPTLVFVWRVTIHYQSRSGCGISFHFRSWKKWRVVRPTTNNSASSGNNFWIARSYWYVDGYR